MVFSLAVWGIFVGWLIMPHSKTQDTARVKQIAYVAAIFIGFGITYFFDFTRQATMFLIGMIAQYMLYFLAMGCRYILKKMFKPRGM